MTQKRSKQEVAIHQINNILASISLTADLLLTESAKGQTKHLKSILADSKKIKQLLAKLK